MARQTPQAWITSPANASLAAVVAALVAVTLCTLGVVLDLNLLLTLPPALISIGIAGACLAVSIHASGIQRAS